MFLGFPLLFCRFSFFLAERKWEEKLWTERGALFMYGLSIKALGSQDNGQAFVAHIKDFQACLIHNSKTTTEQLYVKMLILGGAEHLTLVCI